MLWPMPLACVLPSCQSRLTGCWQPSIKEAAMQPFEYTSPKTKEQVPALLGNSWGEVEILAGGTDLLSLMKDNVTTPRRLVNVKGIQDLHAISFNPDGSVRIGALKTLAELAGTPDLH